jgi:hypothetical protein
MSADLEDEFIPEPTSDEEKRQEAELEEEVGPEPKFG